MPHGHCYLWQPGLVWTHVVSDVLIGLAYLSISLTLYALVRRIRLPFSPIFLAFGVFIGACGLTHFMEVWTLWHPDYWVAGLIKAVTAAASVATGAALFPLRPKIVALAEAARLSEERRVRLESAHAELATLYDRVRESDVLKTQFFANVSHELRTPIALILGPIEEVLASEGLSAHQTARLETVRRNGKTLLKQVNDLLDISKLEAGRMKPVYSRVDLAKMLRFVSAYFETAMQGRSIFFSVAAPEEAPAEADGDKIQRIYMNLLSNAVKFTPQGGRIRVALRIEGEEAVVSFEDSGPGVPPEIRDTIFERFSQGEMGLDRRFGGTGLGLAIVRDFVELHGGSVKLVEGGAPGAKFVVRLPLRAPPGTRVSAGPEATGAFVDPNLEGTVEELSLRVEANGATAFNPTRATVLVCEDNPDMNRFVSETLAVDFNVFRAVDGRDGLAKASAHRPDLIVSDIMMPNMSGDQLMRSIKGHPDLQGTPVLLLSARADDDMRVRLLRDGASDYVMKPFSAEELKARAWNLLAVKRTRDVLQAELDTKSENVVDLARELTARKRQIEAALEAARAARDQAEQASLAKGLFLNLVSHELNTPLTAMLLSIQLLETKEAQALAPRPRQLIEHLSTSARQLRGLVDGLLQYLRSGQAEDRIESIEAGALARETAQQLELIAERKGLDLRVVVDESFSLVTDRNKARIVLSNLAMNAIKFTETGFVEIRARREGSFACFSVRDSGPGIAAPDLRRIFDPFERVEPLERKSAPGVGLGLSIASQLSRALGGEIRIVSALGEGSEFTLRLPLEGPPEDLGARV